jgi:putative DNA primase/helicase
LEASDVLQASGLLEYFKAHARRVHMGLHGHNGEDLLATELAQFLREHDGEWKGEPDELRRALVDRGCEVVPETPDVLSRKMLATSRRGTWLVAEKGWGRKGGKSHRTLRLRLRNGVDGVVGVDPDAA